MHGQLVCMDLSLVDLSSLARQRSFLDRGMLQRRLVFGRQRSVVLGEPG